MTADPTPPRADDQDREALAMIPVIIAAMKGEQEEYWRDPCETRTSIALEDYAQTIAAYLTREGFRRVAPEPVREAPPDPLPHAYGAHFAQPEPQGGEGWPKRAPISQREVDVAWTALDEAGVPNATQDMAIYSLWGRIQEYARMQQAAPAPAAQPVILGPSWMCQRCGANMSLEEAHGITHACAALAPAAPVGVTPDMVNAALDALYGDGWREHSDGPDTRARFAVMRAALAAALAAAGKGKT